MSDRYPGGLIRKTPPTITPPVDGEGGSAPGIWTTDQVAYYEKEGLWPKPVLPRELYTWGDSGNGRTGQNTATIDNSSPVQIGAENNWKNVSLVGDHGAAVKADGSLWMWGYGIFGELGQGNIISRSSPVQVGALTTWAKVATGDWQTIAIKTDGTLWTWGRNTSGILAQNDLIDRSSPVQVGALSTWATISIIGSTAAALKTDGSLWMWGSGSYGLVGQDDTAINRSSPVQVGALTNWAYVADGVVTNNHIGVVKTDGTLWTWGRNAKGQLGIGTYNLSGLGQSSPVQVGALTNWAKVSVGINYTTAIKTDGTLWSWGDNGIGQLGQNISTVTDRSSPVQVGALTDWASVTSGSYHTASVKTDGTLWAWGDAGNGRLGTSTPTSVNRSSPVQVGSDTNWDQTSAGFNTTAATTLG